MFLLIVLNTVVLLPFELSKFVVPLIVVLVVVPILNPVVTLIA